MRACHRCSATACWSASSAALALALATLASACRPSAAEVRVSRIVIDAPRRYDAVPQTREAIRSAVKARLGRDASVVLDERERGATHVLHLRISDPPEQRAQAEQAGGGGAAEQEWAVLVRLRPGGEAPLFETVGRASGNDPTTAVLAAFDDAWRTIAEQRRLEVREDGDLVSALGAEDARLRDFAVIRLGERRSHAAVLPLCDLLQKETVPELVLRAIGSLVAIGDGRAVEPIIELSKRRDPEFVLQVVYAVGAIGGRTAEAYLVTMASGHPVEAVRRGAEQALAEMQRQPARERRGSPAKVETAP